MAAPDPKPVVWIGSSKKDLSAFPEPVKGTIGFALFLAQTADKHPAAKPLRRFRGASVLEVVSDFVGDTYRAVYTVRLAERVYVLHCFQKKSRRGIETPQQDMELVEQRHRLPGELHQELEQECEK
jgi:phage-related protein